MNNNPTGSPLNIGSIYTDIISIYNIYDFDQFDKLDVIFNGIINDKTFVYYVNLQVNQLSTLNLNFDLNALLDILNNINIGSRRRMLNKINYNEFKNNELNNKFKNNSIIRYFNQCKNDSIIDINEEFKYHFS